MSSSRNLRASPFIPDGPNSLKVNRRFARAWLLSAGVQAHPGLNELNDYVLAASFVINRPGDAELRDVSVTDAKHHQTMPRELHFA